MTTFVEVYCRIVPTYLMLPFSVHFYTCLLYLSLKILNIAFLPRAVVVLVTSTKTLLHYHCPVKLIPFSLVIILLDLDLITVHLANSSPMDPSELTAP